MTTKVLLTLGRLPKGLEVARALRQAGADVIVADPFANHLSRPARAVSKSYRTPAPADDPDSYLDALAKIAARERVDLVAPVSEEVLHASRLAARDDAPPFFGAPFDQLARLHHKLRFVEATQNARLNAPKTHPAHTPEAAALASRSDYVLKPALGCSGAGVSLRRKADPLTDADREQGNLVQRRVHGAEISSLSVARDGRTLGTVIYRGLIFAGTVACCFERVDDANAAEAWIEDFIAAENYTGFIGFDFVVDQDGDVWPIECNPRLTSGVHFMNHDDLAAGILDPDFAGPIRKKPQLTFQEGHTSLLMAYADLFRGRFSDFASKLRAMTRAQDVLFEAHDPLPFLLMTPMSWEILKRVAFKGESFGQASTHDIEWNDPFPDFPSNSERPFPAAAPMAPNAALATKDVRDAAHGP
ncbi:MAG: ATP-grasp domain-containing protein [Pseudomonadota bacterium]